MLIDIYIYNRAFPQKMFSCFRGNKSLKNSTRFKIFDHVWPRKWGPQSSVQSPQSKVQSLKSKVQSPQIKIIWLKSSNQSPPTKVLLPNSSYQRHVTKVIWPKSLVQNSESKVVSSKCKVVKSKVISQKSKFQNQSRLIISIDHFRSCYSFIFEGLMASQTWIHFFDTIWDVILRNQWCMYWWGKTTI